MKFKTAFALALLAGGITFSCKDSAKEQEELDRQLEVIETVEESIDSTAIEVHQKAEEVSELIKELDSI